MYRFWAEVVTSFDLSEEMVPFTYTISGTIPFVPSKGIIIDLGTPSDREGEYNGSPWFQVGNVWWNASAASESDNFDLLIYADENNDVSAFDYAGDIQTVKILLEGACENVGWKLLSIMCPRSEKWDEKHGWRKNVWN